MKVKNDTSRTFNVLFEGLTENELRALWLHLNACTASIKKDAEFSPVNVPDDIGQIGYKLFLGVDNVLLYELGYDREDV